MNCCAASTASDAGLIASGSATDASISRHHGSSGPSSGANQNGAISSRPPATAHSLRRERAGSVHTYTARIAMMNIHASTAYSIKAFASGVTLFAVRGRSGSTWTICTIGNDASTTIGSAR